MSENLGKNSSVEQENRIAKLFKASPTPQSGGGKWKKGDILSADYLIECKTTVEPKLTYSVKKSDIDKARHESREMGKKNFIFAFTMGENFDDYFVVDDKFMRDYLELRSNVERIYNQTKAQLVQIQQKAEQLTLSAGRGEYEITELDKTSFQIHKNRLTSMMESLEEIM